MDKKNELLSINWKAMGAELARLSNEEQSEFFTGFAIELDHYETHYAKETQMTAINLKLQEKTKKALKEYLPALWFKEGDE